MSPENREGQADHLVTDSHKSIVASLQITSCLLFLSPRSVTVQHFISFFLKYCRCSFRNVMKSQLTTEFCSTEPERSSPFSLSPLRTATRRQSFARGHDEKDSTSRQSDRPDERQGHETEERAGCIYSPQGLLPTELPIKTSY